MDGCTLMLRERILVLTCRYGDVTVPDPSYSGRLELTWTNKDQRLLAHEDGSYEWVAPADYRVAEVHLLDNQGTVGKVHGDDERAKDNLLIRGDALQALTSLLSIPEFRDEYAGKVKLAYLDPPFNTQQAFEHYDDALEHSVWLTMMRDRLQLVKELLSPDGSLYVHCDGSEGHYLKVLLDEIFGRPNFRNEIIWKRQAAHSDSKQGSQHYGRLHESLLWYTVGDSYLWNQLHQPYDESYVRTFYSNVDADGRRFQYGDLTGPGGPAKGNPVYEFLGVTRAWRYSRERMEQLHRAGRIEFRPGGKVPRLKRYLDEAKGIPLQDLWTDISYGPLINFGKENTGYSTQKPEALIARIVRVSSNPGDIVLDCFLGSGTTAAVAHKMERRWVGVEWNDETVISYAAPRLTKAVQGQDPGGVTKEVGWQGGDGFRILDVAPSMFCEEGGIVYLADWATSGKLAEATAAQLGYTYEPDSPFAGRLGRSRLAVIDGLVNEAVVRVLANALVEYERVVVCGTAIDPAARDVLAALRPGSSVRKIPSSILQEYRLARRTPFARYEEPEPPLQPSLLSSEGGTWP